MSYFEELLESYSLLKKRKLSFRINESEESSSDTDKDSSDDSTSGSGSTPLDEVDKLTLKLINKCKLVYEYLTKLDRLLLPAIQDGESLGQALCGNAPDSLIPQILMAKGFIYDEFGNIVFNAKQPLHEDSQVLILKSLDKLFSLFTKSKIEETEANTVKQIFFFGKDGAVVIRSLDQTTCLVFRDLTNLLKALLLAFQARFNIKFLTYDLSSPQLDLCQILATVLQLPDKRSLELFYSPVASIRRAQVWKGFPTIGPAAQMQLSELQALLQQAQGVYQMAYVPFEMGMEAITHDDYEIYLTLKDLFNPAKNLVGKYKDIVKGTINSENIQYVLRSGRKNALGVNDDIIKIWIKPPIDFNPNFFLKLPVATFIKDYPEHQEVVQEGIVNPNMPIILQKSNVQVFTNPIHTVKMGEILVQDIHRILDIHPELTQKALIDSKFDGASLLEIKRYAAEIGQYLTKIDAMSSRTFVRTSSGELIQSNPLLQLLKSIKELTLKNSTYDEGYGNVFVSPLLTLIDCYLEDPENQYEVDTVKNLKKLLKVYYYFNKITTDTKKNRQDALKYLKVLIHLLVESVSNFQTLEILLLGSGERISIPQNGLIEAFDDESNPWSVYPKGLNLELCSEKNKDKFILLKSRLIPTGEYKLTANLSLGMIRN